MEISPKIKLGIGQRVSKSEADFGYRDVTDTPMLNKPTLLAFCGARTTTTKDANAFAKLAQDLLGRADVYDSELQIISAYYPPGYDLRAARSNYNNKAELHEDGNYQPFVDQLVQKQFLPLVANISGDGNPTRLSLEQASKNLRNITMLGYSYGGVVIAEIGNCLCETMQRLGYSDAEISAATRQVNVITAGSTALYGHDKANFSGLHVLNIGDAMVGLRSNNIAVAKNLINHSTAKNEPFAIVPLPGKEQYIIAAQPIEAMPRTNDSGSFVDKTGKFFSTRMDDKGELIKEYYEPGQAELPKLTDNEGHTTYTYFNYGLGTNGILIPNTIAIALTNAVNNSIANAHSENLIEAPDRDALLVPSRQIQFKRSTMERSGLYSAPEAVATATGYTSRITQALERNNTSMVDKITETKAASPNQLG